MAQFNTLDTVPVHYARPPVGDYGTRGVQHTFKCTKPFLDELEACFKELHSTCWLGRPEVITSAGAEVNKPGQHGSGTAFDLDGLFWTNIKLITIDFPKFSKLYLGIESILRRYFGTVLNYLYNTAHEDHWHFDTGTAVKFDRTSKSRVLYVQACAKYIFNIQLEIDGVWGSDTLGAVERMNDLLATNHDIHKVADWKAFLLDVANEAFDKAEKELDLSDDEPIPVSGFVATNKLNIRSGPSGEHEKVAQPLKEGQKVAITESSGEWVKVQTTIEGWVHSKYIKS